MPRFQARLPDESSIMEFLYDDNSCDDQEETESESDHDQCYLLQRARQESFLKQLSMILNSILIGRRNLVL